MLKRPSEKTTKKWSKWQRLPKNWMDKVHDGAEWYCELFEVALKVLRNSET